MLRYAGSGVGVPWLRGLAGLGVPALALLIAVLVSATAHAIPLGIANPSCPASSAAATTCRSSGPGIRIYGHSDLAGLTATAEIDAGPQAFTTQAFVRYYFELISSTGSFPASIPLQVLANGRAEVGGTPSSPGVGFNANSASSSVKIGPFGFFACAGVGCAVNEPTSFSGTRTVDLVPGSSASGFGPNVFEVVIRAQASTNSNYPSSYAYAFADPYIVIDPAFAAANPGYSLGFSDNVVNAPPVPEPASATLVALGLAALARSRSATGSSKRSARDADGPK